MYCCVYPSILHYSYTLLDVVDKHVYCSDSRCKGPGMVCKKYENMCIYPLGIIGKHCGVGYNRFQIYVCY